MNFIARGIFHSHQSFLNNYLSSKDVYLHFFCFGKPQRSCFKELLLDRLWDYPMKKIHGKGNHPLIDGTESIVLKTFNGEQ